MEKLIIVGHCSKDFVINYDGETATVPSGAAYLATVGASNFSSDVGLVTRVGCDYDMSSLQDLGISLDGVKLDKTGRSSQFVLVYQSEDYAERDFLGYLNVGANIRPNDVPAQYLMAKYIFISTMPPQQQRIFIDYFRQVAPNAKLAIDSLEQYIENEKEDVWRNFLDCDICFVDKRELSLISEIRSQNNVSVVIKRGKDGAEFISDKMSFTVGAPLVDKIVDKTGSGDVLAGAFLAQITNGVSHYIALEKAICIASISIKEFGVKHIYSFYK